MEAILGIHAGIRVFPGATTEKDLPFSLRNQMKRIQLAFFWSILMTKEAIRLVSDVDVANFALSPDGENLAYISDDNMLSILNTRTKAKEDVYAIQ